METASTLPWKEISVLQIYINALRTGVVMIVGRMNAPGLSELENLLFSICMPLGVCVQAVVFGRIAMIIQRREAVTQAQTQKLDEIRQAMLLLRLPTSIQTRILSYYAYMQLHRNQRSLSGLFVDLADHLKVEMRLYLYCNLVLQAPFLQKTPGYILRQIIMALTENVFLPGDWVCRYGEDGDGMYFIVKGQCSILSKSMMPLSKLGLGSYFGEVSLLTGGQRTAFVRADQFCTLACLPRELFDPILQQFPEQVDLMVTLFWDSVKAWHRKMRQYPDLVGPAGGTGSTSLVQMEVQRRIQEAEEDDDDEEDSSDEEDIENDTSYMDYSNGRDQDDACSDDLGTYMPLNQPISDPVFNKHLDVEDEKAMDCILKVDDSNSGYQPHSAKDSGESDRRNSRESPRHNSKETPGRYSMESCEASVKNDSGPSSKASSRQPSMDSRRNGSKDVSTEKRTSCLKRSSLEVMPLAVEKTFSRSSKVSISEDPDEVVNISANEPVDESETALHSPGTSADTENASSRQRQSDGALQQAKRPSQLKDSFQRSSLQGQTAIHKLKSEPADKQKIQPLRKSQLQNSKRSSIQSTMSRADEQAHIENLLHDEGEMHQTTPQGPSHGHMIRRRSSTRSSIGIHHSPRASVSVGSATIAPQSFQLQDVERIVAAKCEQLFGKMEARLQKLEGSLRENNIALKNEFCAEVKHVEHSFETTMEMHFMDCIERFNLLSQEMKDVMQVNSQGGKAVAQTSKLQMRMNQSGCQSQAATSSTHEQNISRAASSSDEATGDKKTLPPKDDAPQETFRKTMTSPVTDQDGKAAIAGIQSLQLKIPSQVGRYEEQEDKKKTRRTSRCALNPGALQAPEGSEREGARSPRRKSWCAAPSPSLSNEGQSMMTKALAVNALNPENLNGKPQRRLSGTAIPTKQPPRSSKPEGDVNDDNEDGNAEDFFTL